MTRCLSPAIEEDPQDATEDCDCSHVLIVIYRHHVRVSEHDLTDEALLAFLQEYAKTSLKGDHYDLTFLGPEIEYQMNLKPSYTVENLASQCEKIIQTYGLQQIVETKAGKKKWRHASPRSN